MSVTFIPLSFLIEMLREYSAVRTVRTLWQYFNSYCFVLKYFKEPNPVLWETFKKKKPNHSQQKRLFITY